MPWKDKDYDKRELRMVEWGIGIAGSGYSFIASLTSRLLMVTALNVSAVSLGQDWDVKALILSGHYYTLHS